MTREARSFFGWAACTRRRCWSSSTSCPSFCASARTSPWKACVPGTLTLSKSLSGPTMDQLVDIATRFYLSGQSQIEIARGVGLDASTVSRYLKRARDEGIVRVEIKRPRTLHGDLALELAQDFHLKRAVVVAGPPGPGSAHAVACAAAGGPARRGLSLPRHIASLHPHSHVHYLHAPVLVDSPDIKDAMLRDGSIRAALESAASSELAMVGIGTLDESAPLISFGHISPKDRRRLLASGAVGDMCTRFFTPEGEPVHVLDDRLIAIEWDGLKRIPLVVAMAAGLDKRDAILGALRAGCINVLITDESTARAVLKPVRRG